MSTQTGLESRYEVKKINDIKGKHNNCRYFVLDPEHDPYAAIALRAYADAAKSFPALQEDIIRWLRELNYCPNCSQVKGHRGPC